MSTTLTDTPAPDYGEPWVTSDEDDIVSCNGDGGALCYAEGNTRDRIIACVNAMSGVPDPAAFVAEAKANAAKLAAMEQERTMQDHLESHL